MPIPVSGFFISSLEEKYENLFFGVAFEGNDIIFHQDGLNIRNNKKNEKFLPEEGSYINIIQLKDGIHISTDPSGMCKLYIYEDGINWGVSDSFYELCSEIKNLGWNIEPNLAAIHSTKIGGWFGDQLLSYNTVFKQIKLVPH